MIAPNQNTNETYTVNKKVAIQFRVQPEVAEMVQKLADQERVSVSRLLHRCLEGMLEKAGKLGVEKSFSPKEVGQMLNVHAATILRKLAANLDIPVENRGKPGTRIPESSLMILRARMRS